MREESKGLSNSLRSKVGDNNNLERVIKYLVSKINKEIKKTYLRKDMSFLFLLFFYVLVII